MLCTRFSVAAFLTAATLSAGAAGAASISLVGPVGSVNVGESFSLVLQGEDMPDFSSFQADLTYDRDFVDYAGGTFNSGFLPFLTSDQLANVVPGSGPITLVSISGAALGTTLGGDLDVVTFNFTATAAGDADFTLAPFESLGVPSMFALAGVGPVFNDTVFATVTIVDDTVTAPIPLPASMWLLGAGVLGLFGSRRVLRDVSDQRPEDI